MTQGKASVSVIIPCRNEAGHIAACLQSILTQEGLPDGCALEVIVADGMSDDGTRERLGRIAATDPRVVVIDNPGRIVSTGLNSAVAAARGEVIVRMDVHTTYDPRYLAHCLEALERTGADNVGGPWVARGEGYLSRAIAAAFRSPFAVGGARGHDPSYEGPLDTVYLGCWRRSVFDRIGGFDEELVRNQDDEFNLRLLLGGGTIWQSPRIQSWYCPRSSLRALFRQYFQYGYWKVRVVQKHRRPASPRHLVPVVFVLALALGWLPALVWPPLGLPYLAMLALYGALTLAFAARSAAGAGWDLFPALVVILPTFHLAYGAGFALGLLDFVALRRVARTGMTSLTRNAPPLPAHASPSAPDTTPSP